MTKTLEIDGNTYKVAEGIGQHDHPCEPADTGPCPTPLSKLNFNMTMMLKHNNEHEVIDNEDDPGARNAST
jgi:hypothetical protein